MITVSGLTKKYGDRTVVDDVSFDAGARHGDRLPRPERRRQDDDDADDDRPGRADRRARRSWTGSLYAELPNPGAVVGTLLDASAVHPGRTGRTHLRLLARHDRRLRPAGWTRCSSWSGSPTPRAGGSAATRWACGSGSGSPGRCSPTRRC